MRGERSVIIDVLRGIAIFIVVFGHTLQYCNNMDPTQPVQMVIMTFWMPLFFLISGFSSGFGIKNSLWVSVKKKSLRLLVPYLCWIVLLSVSDGFRPLTSDFWFLRMMYAIVIIDTVIDILLDKWVYRLFVWGALAVLLNYVQGLNGILQFSVLYVAGKVAFVMKDMPKAKQVVAVLGLVFPLEIPFYLNATNSFWCFFFDKSMAITGSSFALCIAFMLCRYDWCEMIIRILQWFGKRSLAIYAIHWCLFFHLGVLGMFSRNPLIMFIVWMCSCVFIIYIWNWIAKGMNRFYSVNDRKLMGVE